VSEEGEGSLSLSSGNGQGKIRVLTRDELDGRSSACKQFDAIARGVCTDLGGEDQITTVMKHLVECFAGIAIQVSNCNARLLLGEQVDVAEHSQAATTLVRLASRLGLKRVARDLSIVPPSAEEYFAHKARVKQATPTDVDVELVP
jgi:hypothetical protein